MVHTSSDNPKVQYNIGLMYLEGVGVTRNDEEVYKWLKKSAISLLNNNIQAQIIMENPDAQFMLGQMYSKGKGVKQDYVEAIKWSKHAVVQGHHEAGIVSDAN
uniref:HCP-like protein n=2 Tax=Rhizophagus irregularis TaxID=588596 RepID=U9V2C0_RHIID